jgi:hypothetical protein
MRAACCPLHFSRPFHEKSLEASPTSWTQDIAPGRKSVQHARVGRVEDLQEMECGIWFVSLSMEVHSYKLSRTQIPISYT